VIQLVVALAFVFGACVLIAAPPSRAFSRKAIRAIFVMVAGIGIVIAVLVHRAALRDLRSAHAAQLREICSGESVRVMGFKLRLQQREPRMPQNELIDRWSELSRSVRGLWGPCMESPPACEEGTGLLPTEDDLARIERAFKTGDSCGRSDE